MALWTLTARRQHHAAVMGLTQHGHQLGVAGRAGTAAIAFQQQPLHTAVEQSAEVTGLQCRVQRQHGQIDPLPYLAVVDEGADPAMLCLTLTLQRSEEHTSELQSRETLV